MSEKKTWRVAFIGTGMVVQWSHIPSFRRLEGVEAVAVCDVNEERALRRQRYRYSAGLHRLS